MNELTKPQIGVLSILLAIMLGIIDWLSGVNISFFVFYFLPVSLAAWFIGTFASMALAAICSLIWFSADTMGNYMSVPHAYVAWNTIVRLISFMVIARIVSKLRITVDIEKEKSLQLQASLAEIKILKSFLRICSKCKKIHDERGDWQQLEVYISMHANTRFSHGYCPQCYQAALLDADLL